MKQKSEKIQLLEQINQKNMNFQMVRELQQDIFEKDKTIKELQRKEDESQRGKFTRKRNMTLSSVISRQKLSNLAVEKFRNSICNTGILFEFMFLYKEDINDNRNI